MKKIVRTILLAGLMITMLGGVNVYANELEINNIKGNGNDGCQIGNIPGHKDHGQSNEHKIDYMTKAEWEGYLIANNLIGQQMSNNEGSNGWITYHIYNSEGKQIEVVHIKFKAEEVPPVEEKPEKVPSVEEKPEEIPPVEEKPEEIPPVEEKPEEVPPVEEKPEEDIPMTPIEPSIPVKPEEGNKPEEEEGEGNKEEDKEEIPMTPLEPSNPVVPEKKPEDSEPMLPLEPSIPVEEEDSMPTKPTKDDIELESDKITENNLNDNNNIVNTNTEISDDNNNHYTNNPKTGDAGLGLTILGVIGSIGGIGIVNRKRK